MAGTPTCSAHEEPREAGRRVSRRSRDEGHVRHAHAPVVRAGCARASAAWVRPPRTPQGWRRPSARHLRRSRAGALFSAQFAAAAAHSGARRARVAPVIMFLT
eukprot:scaffold886_cov317-Prasinococcus_capsulatus_cf.AAC.17